jgi:prenyltransferase beta subunit
MPYSKAGRQAQQYMLQRYIFLCAQDAYGGLCDKPSKSHDS